jgi:hypothetical protein
MPFRRLREVDQQVAGGRGVDEGDAAATATATCSMRLIFMPPIPLPR